MAERAGLLLVVAAVVWINWRLVARTGFPGFASLILYVPALNLVALVALAFMEWPIEERTRRLRFAQSNMLDGYLRSRSDEELVRLVDFGEHADWPPSVLSAAAALLTERGVALEETPPVSTPEVDDASH